MSSFKKQLFQARKGAPFVALFEQEQQAFYIPGIPLLSGLVVQCTRSGYFRLKAFTSEIPLTFFSISNQQK